MIGFIGGHDGDENILHIIVDELLFNFLKN